jgi:hypothetical protein
MNTDGIFSIEKRPLGRIHLKRTLWKTQSVSETFARQMPRDPIRAGHPGRGGKPWRRGALPWLERRGRETPIMAMSQGSMRQGWESPEMPSLFPPLEEF